MTNVIPPPTPEAIQSQTLETTGNQVPWWAWFLGALIFAFMAMIVAMFGLYLWLAQPMGGTADREESRPSLSVNLASLVTEESSRAQLAGYFSDLSTTIRDEKCPVKTTGQFRSAYRTSVTHFKSLGKLPDMEAIDKPISDAIASAIGLEDRPLDGEPPLRHSLANVLEDVSENVGK